MRSIDFVGRRRQWMAISAVLLLLSLGALLLRGLDLSIDFVGGTAFTVEQVGEPDVTAQQLNDVAADAGATDVVAQLVTEDGATAGAIVRTAALDPGGDTEQAVLRALQDATAAEAVDVTFVGPSWGERVSQQALRALLVFLVVVVIYISARLEPKMAGAAILALVHDVIITVGAYALLDFTVSPSTVIAVLTILGYSLYDSVVVFDRVEENAERLGDPGRRSYGEMVNTSMNEVFGRSLNTSVTSLLPVGALLFIGANLLGAETLRDLSLALFVGMALGIYSSLFVAGPFLAWWKEREPEYATMARRLEEKIEAGVAEEVTAAEAVADRAPITTEYVRGSGKKKKRR